MKKVLLGTTAIVAAGMIASAPAAIAAEKISAKVGGYHEEWVGYVGQDEIGSADHSGLDVKTDSEIFFTGMGKMDNGVSFGFNVQLEGNTTGDTIDESYMIIKGSFGEMNIGSENSAQYKMHYAPSDVGIGMNSGDQHDWVSTSGITGGTTGTFRGPYGSTYTEAGRANDANRFTYYTPRMSGVQLGVSYIPSSSEDTNSAPDRESGQTDGVSGAINYKGDFGGTSIKASAGYGMIQSNAAGTDDENVWNVGLVVGVAGFNIGASYADADNDDASGEGDATGYNVGVGYGSGPWAMSLAWYHGERKGSSTVAETDHDAVHLSAKYALGPGVTAAGTLGYTKFDSKLSTDTDNTGTYLVVGVKLSF